MKSNLRIPGPTPLPLAVRKALGRQMINHRGEEYKELQMRVTKHLQHFFQTKQDVFLYTASGTGGLEAAIVNFFSPGDTILSFTCGIFGERWADAARAYGLRVVQKKFPHGEAVSLNALEKVVRQEKKVAGIFITHNETSTGVLNPIKEISEIVKKSFREKEMAPLLCIDAVSSLGAVDLPMDEWGIDVVITASQKAWMAPPGLSMMAVSRRAWAHHKVARLPRYYFDITLMKQYAEKQQTPATPALTTMYGLDAAIGLMLKEGRDQIFTRHIALRDRFRRDVRGIGLELLVDDTAASPTVTAILVPDGIDAHHWMQLLERDHGLIVGGGLGELKGKIIRVAHMGFVKDKSLQSVIHALSQSRL